MTGNRQALRRLSAGLLVALVAIPVLSDAVEAQAAPAISAVHAGDKALTVVWTAPSGVTGIMGYHLRHILTSADEAVDANWAVEEGIRSGGQSGYVLAGLTNGAGYDVQVRAVTDTRGAWSPTVAGTPAEPGATRATALDLPLDVTLGGHIDTLSDKDYFKFVLTEETGLVSFSQGGLDTLAWLYDNDGIGIVYSDTGGIAGAPFSYLIWGTFDAGTYYLRVEARGTGAYRGPGQNDRGHNRPQRRGGGRTRWI